jgi:hypothetical protein
MNEEQLRRLSDCEVIINRYHDKLVEYMMQCDNYSKQIMPKDEFQRIWEDFNNRMSRDFGMLRKDILSLSDKDRDLLEKIEFLNKELVRLHFDHHQMINRQGAHVEKLLLEAENSNMTHKSHQKYIEHIQVKLNECERMSSEINELKKFFHICNGSLQEQINILSKKLDGFESKFQLCSSNTIMNQVNLEDHKKHYQDQMDDFKVIVKAISSQMQSNFDQMFRRFEDRINSLPVPEKVQLPDFDKMLADQQVDTLEKVNLKARKIEAALEQAKSNEMQMTVMNKKMEKILEILSNNDFN